MKNLLNNFDVKNSKFIDEEQVEKFDKKESGVKIAVLVMSCNRPNSVENHLKQLIEKRVASDSVAKFPIIVSQDCNHFETANMIEKYSSHLFASIKVRALTTNFGL